MQIVFDRGLETQRAINVDFFGENISRGTLNASMNKALSADDTAVPDLGTLQSGFTSMDIADGDIPVPVQGSYNAVLDASAAYNARTHEYSVTVVLGHRE